MRTPLVVVSLVVILATGVAQSQKARPDPLSRSGVVVQIAVTDAKGNPLVLDGGQTADISLWRKCGRWAQRAPARFDAGTSRLICGGYNDRGLERGKYVLKCVLGAYGTIEHEFSTEAGLPPAHTHQFKTWRRIVTLKLQGKDGKPAKILGSEPTYVFAPDKPPSLDAESIPDVLHKAPGGFAFRRARGGPPTAPELHYLTDNGCWYVAVIAGREGEISGPVAVAGNFEGEKFDKPVEVTLDQDVAGLTARDAANTEDPGRRSILGVKEPTAELYITLPYTHELRPELSDPSIRLVPGGSDWIETGIMRFRASVPKDRPLQYRIVGGPLYQSEWRALPKPDAAGKIELTHLEVPALISVSAEGGTFGQWFDWCQVAIGPINRDDARATMVTPGRSGGSYVDAARIKEIVAAGKLDVYFGGAAGARPDLNHGFIPWPAGSRWLDTQFFSTQITLTNAQIALLERNKAVRVAVSFQGVILRAITADGVGVPQSQVSVMPLKEEKVALRLKKILQDAASKGEPIKAEGKGSIAAKEDKDVTDNDLRDVLGQATFTALASRESRLRFARKGVWYANEAIATGDPHGFVLAPEALLEPGEKYVLYLWGGSRNEYTPDLRVEFTYTSAGVDLGARVVSDYK